MADEPPTPTVGDHDRVSGDVACIRCGYNLHTLDPAGDCPECGSPVALSLRSTELAHADPLWLSTIAFGAALATLAASGAAVIWLVPLEAAVDANALYPYVYSLHYVLPFTVCVSTWLITARDHEAPAPEPTLSLRQAIRIVVTVCTIIDLVLLAGWHTGSFAWSVIGIAWGVLGIAGTFMFYTYVRGLGFRGGDLFVASHAPIVMWVGIVALAVVQLLPWGQALLRHFGLELSTGPLHLERLLGIVSGIYAAIYLWNVRTMLRRAAVQARGNWRERDREPTPPAS